MEYLFDTTRAAANLLLAAAIDRFSRHSSSSWRTRAGRCLILRGDWRAPRSSIPRRRNGRGKNILPAEAFLDDNALSCGRTTMAH